MSFKDISNLELWQPFYSAEQNPLCNFGQWAFLGTLFFLSTDGSFVYQIETICAALDYEEHFCEIKLNLDQWFKRI